MKKFAIICTIVFGISAVLFFASFVFIDRGKFVNKIPEVSKNSDHVFTESFSDIVISTISADTEILVSPTEETTVTYTTEQVNTSLKAEISGDTLKITETVDSFLFSFININNVPTKLTIAIPDKVYKSVTINKVSGDVSSEKLVTDELELNGTSGDVDMQVYGDTLRISSTSGDMKLTNCTDKKSRSLNISTTSGDYFINGFATDSFVISTMSGDLELTGVSGKGNLDVTSGSVTLEYSEWSDSLDISALSGNVEVILPEGSGANVDFSALSGSCRIRLDDDSLNLKNGNIVTVGGDNVQDVNIDISSGDITIKN